MSKSIFLIIKLLIIFLELCILGVLLFLNLLLPLLQSQLGLSLETLIRSKLLLLTGRWILTNLLMDSLIQLLQAISLDPILNVSGKLGLVLGVIFLLKIFHVLADVSAKDTFAVHIGVVLFGITIISRETLFGMGNVQTSVSGTLECAEDTASSRGGLASDVEEGAEGTLVLIDLVNEIGALAHFGLHNASIDFGVAFIDVIEADFLEEAASTQQSGAVGRGVVLETDLKSVAGQLVRAGAGQDAISVNERVHNLTNDLLVGETDNKAVFGRLVFVLRLAAEAFALTVVSAALATTAELDLVAFEVRFGFLNFNKRLEGSEVTTESTCQK